MNITKYIVNVKPALAVHKARLENLPDSFFSSRFSLPFLILIKQFYVSIALQHNSGIPHIPYTPYTCRVRVRVRLCVWGITDLFQHFQPIWVCANIFCIWLCVYNHYPCMFLEKLFNAKYFSIWPSLKVYHTTHKLHLHLEHLMGLSTMFVAMHFT